jgi:4-aminobutyrate aminotransferase
MSTMSRTLLSRSAAALKPSIRSFSTSYPHHQYSENLPQGLSQFSDCIAVDAKGSWINAKNGRKYLDFACGIGVTNLGHCHPRVNAAAKAQLDKGIHLQVNCVSSPPMLELVKKFKPHLPAPMQEDYQILFSNSGAESIENSIKLARMVTGRQTVIVFQGGFHGRTIASGALTTAKYVYRSGFQPTMAGVHVAPFAYCHRCPVSCAQPEKFNTNNCCNSPIDQLKLLLKQQTGENEVAAILIEPILGEGGYVVPPAGFLQAVQKVANDIGALLIADEVQTGFGRTGNMFAYQTFDFQPDILVMAKGIANGFPLSAIAAHSKILSKAKPGSIGGTYGGNAVSCAAACAVLDTFEQDKVLDNVRSRAKQFRAGLEGLAKKFPIADVRGVGLMQAIEFSDKNGVANAAGAVVKACVSNDLLVLSAGVYESLRFIPPLTITEEEMNEGLIRIEKSLKQVFKK